jgi:hypothetical protein
MRKHATLAVLGAIIGAACGGVASEGKAEGSPPEPKESAISIRAFDFGFDTGGVSSLPAGLVTFTMTNDGKQPHHAQFLRLNEGVDFEEFAQTVEANPAPANLDFAPVLRSLYDPPASGVLNWVSAGEEISPKDELEPGSYVLLCAIKDPKSGRRHYEMGMLQPFEVGSTQGSAR